MLDGLLRYKVSWISVTLPLCGRECFGTANAASPEQFSIGHAEGGVNRRYFYDEIGDNQRRGVAGEPINPPQ